MIMHGMFNAKYLIGSRKKNNILKCIEGGLE